MGGPLRRWIDLHLHSTASDGHYAPAKLVEMAAVRGLAAIALTDHDTIDGLPEAAEAASQHQIEFVSGVEIEAAHGRKRLHLLGYGFDPDWPELREALASMLEQRHARNRRIIARLNELGVEIDYESVQKRARGAVGRPHIADELMRRRVVSGFQQAFSKYLGNEAPAYIPREAIDSSAAIAMIRKAGGTVSLAHPGRVTVSSHLELATLIADLRDQGLSAIEVLHPDHNDAQVRHFGELAERFNLRPSGGSDFHSLGRAVHRGVGFAKRRVPYDWLECLRASPHTR